MSHTQEAHAARWVRRLDEHSGRAFGVGKRKTSVALVWVKEGTGARLGGCGARAGEAAACPAASRPAQTSRQLARPPPPPTAARRLALVPLRATGQLLVNRRPYDAYFPDLLRRNDLLAPFLGAHGCWAGWAAGLAVVWCAALLLGPSVLLG